MSEHVLCSPPRATLSQPRCCASGGLASDLSQCLCTLGLESHDAGGFGAEAAGGTRQGLDVERGLCGALSDAAIGARW